MRCGATLRALALLLAAGAARGDVVYLTSTIDHDEVGQPTGSPAAGWGSYVLDTDANTLDYFIEYRGLVATEIMSHFHGYSCLGTSILEGLPLGSPKIGTWNYPEVVECEILAGHFWVVIHTDLHTTGEIAGFLLPVPYTLESFCWGSGCPCANDDPSGGCASSTGRGAAIESSGTASVLFDHLVLRAAPVPPGRPGLFLMGTSRAHLVFGDGWLCIDGGARSTLRFPLQISNGELVLGPGLIELARGRFPPAGRIALGSTWIFQALYRDPSGPCGNGWNASNALAATFVL